nr:hypothetical protein [Tanacetum cinerariifolium]
CISLVIGQKKVNACILLYDNKLFSVSLLKLDRDLSERHKETISASRMRLLSIERSNSLLTKAFK